MTRRWTTVIVLLTALTPAWPAPQTNQHWSFQTPHRAEVPPVKDERGVRNPIDAFVRARLEQENLTPSAEADRATLLRRLSFDLLGLPPGPEAVAAFVADPRPDAYEQTVDRLLASPHFGEQWGRHWLDLARYAESDGYEKDQVRPYAWLYRDWVIDAINRDLTFDRFTIEQLAGDLLPEASLEQKTATGFHRQTLTNKEGGVDQEEFRCKATVDRVDTTAAVWLGLTLGCAECHSHKYDPITQREFYQVYAFFNNASEKDLPAPRPEELARYNAEKKQWDEANAQLKAALGAHLTGDFSQDYREEIDPGTRKFNERLATHAKKEPKFPETKAATLADEAPRKTHIHMRGDFLRKGEEVQPGTLAVLPPLTPRQEKADRLDLARWLVDPANPLTARVTVNHVWRYLFGRGLVATVNDFGTRGEAPSHPELLDWLAVTFMTPPDEPRSSPALLDESAHSSQSESGNRKSEIGQPGCGWSRKALIKLIVLSATYRQSSRARPDLIDRDPTNVLLARQNRFRLEAENVRDAYLAASGLLNAALGGPSIRPPLPADVAAIGYANSIKWKESEGVDRYRRGLYIFFQRTVPYPMLMTFDAPDSNVTCTRRERSNTPLQALTLWNDPVFVECAQALGRRMAEDVAASIPVKIAHGFERCMGRSPLAAEQKRLEKLYHDYARLIRSSPEDASKILGYQQKEENQLTEKATLVAVARTILNLDEFVTRE